MPAAGRAWTRRSVGTADRCRLEDPEPASQPAGRLVRHGAREGKRATPGRGSRGMVIKLVVVAAAATVAHGLLPATLSALPRAARVLGAGLGSAATDSALGPRGPAHARWTCYSGPEDASTPGVRPSVPVGMLQCRG